MKAILLVSHGKMAEGVKDAVSLIADASRVEALGLMPSDSPEDFKAAIEAKISEMNTEAGAIVFVDLLGGTPGHQAAYLCVQHDNIEVVTGMNLPMILEYVTMSEFVDDIEIENIIATGRDGIQHLNKLLNQ